MSHELSVSEQLIENRIFTIRNLMVMVDYHLAELYNVETKRINEQVKRNIERFPESFMFQLSNLEWSTLQSQIATSEKNGTLQSQIATAKRRTNPYVFIEQGVAMLSAVLKSDTAIKVSVKVMDSFVKMRQLLLQNSLLNLWLDRLESKQLENDQKFEMVFKALENKEITQSQGIFFDGQMFDAYAFIADLVRSADDTIVLVDNYIDDTVLTLLSKKKSKVRCILLTKNISKQLLLDAEKFNKQYPILQLIQFDKAHDRFLIIDQQEVYHIGASLKDLGKKWFAFSKMDKDSVTIIRSIMNLI